MEKKLGQEPAFPRTAKISENSAKSDFSNLPHEGISKRFYAACAAMQGLIAGVRASGDGIDAKILIQSSYLLADELLEQENL